MSTTTPLNWSSMTLAAKATAILKACEDAGTPCPVERALMYAERGVDFRAAVIAETGDVAGAPIVTLSRDETRQLAAQFAPFAR